METHLSHLFDAVTLAIGGPVIKIGKIGTKTVIVNLNEIKAAFKAGRATGGAANAAKKPIAIGENMNRVKAYADEIGGHAYTPWKNDPFDFGLAMKRDQRWINDMMKDGRQIIDIGSDIERRVIQGASDFYEMERKQLQLKGYENYTKVFQRNGNTGGVQGLDY